MNVEISSIFIDHLCQETMKRNLKWISLHDYTQRGEISSAVERQITLRHKNNCNLNVTSSMISEYNSALLFILTFTISHPFTNNEEEKTVFLIKPKDLKDFVLIEMDHDPILYHKLKTLQNIAGYFFFNDKHNDIDITPEEKSVKEYIVNTINPIVSSTEFVVQYGIPTPGKRCPKWRYPQDNESQPHESVHKEN